MMSPTPPKPAGKAKATQPARPEEPLSEYRRKRDFAKTPEPSGQSPPHANQAIFVVHKHDASRLHYDLRLQIDETMPSWAVPKGPSLNPADKRLAVRVEDHPLDYAEFEGTIPKEEYGGGTVMIWDCGTVQFKEEGKTPHEWLDAGMLEFELAGRKLNGQWKLIRTKMGGDAKNWLLIKRKDAFARLPSGPGSPGGPQADILIEQPDSAKTGRSLEQIAAEGEK